MNKTCIDCLRALPEKDFYRNRRNIASRCKACHAQEGLERRFLRLYGISHETYNDMFAAQCGVCAICGEKQSKRNGRITRLAVDHDHKTGKVRSLLCTRCNLGIGFFLDEQDRLAAAMEYLKRWQ